MRRNKNAIFHTTEVIVLILITCVISIGMGYILGKRMDNKTHLDSEQNADVIEFLNNYQYIMENYYGEIDSKTLLNGALDGMLNTLEDDYSVVIDSNTFDIQLEGDYEGIGIEIYKYDNQITILRVFDGSAAEKAGLQSGDVIVSIDGIDYTDKSTNDLTDYIKNSEHESFTMGILRNEEQMEISLNRGHVTIPSVESKVFERDDKIIGYIYIDIFATATSKQFSTALKDLENKNIDGLVLDVRNNSGGHLTTAANILSNFLDKSNVIYQTETKNKIKKFYSKGSITKKYPIVILQNQSSASASELLSIALKEQYGATVVGEKSYGKGTIQELVVSGDTEYKFTTKRWLSPKGNWIHKEGVLPDIEITLDEKFYNNPTDENDNQLQMALNSVIDK